MPGRAESPRHRFDLALIKPASNGVEVNFHKLFKNAPDAVPGVGCAPRTAHRATRLRLHHHKIIK
jgi:hypothetical protein